jgi:NAD(P)H-hydrate epimerase
LDVAIRADATLTLGAVKQGLLRTHAAPFVGRLEVAPGIGLVPYPWTTAVSLSETEDYQRFPPARAVGAHKGTHGHVAIVAGSRGYHGAALLAARGAQRAQPGLVTLLAHESIYPLVAAQTQAVMVQPWSREPELPEGCSAVVVGPGLADRELADLLPRLVRRWWSDLPLALIVDASALDWLPAGPAAEQALRVITPHPGEAARLLQRTVQEVQEDRITAARDLSQRYGDCQVVLKGHQTVIVQGRGAVLVNHSGNPHLAQGGSGDLLAGYLGGLWAQPELQKIPDQALRFGVWQHGAAADALLARKPAFIIEELAEALGGVSP